MQRQTKLSKEEREVRNAIVCAYAERYGIEDLVTSEILDDETASSVELKNRLRMARADGLRAKRELE